MRIDLPLSRAVYTASRWHSALEASTGCEPLIGASPLENKGKIVRYLLLSQEQQRKIYQMAMSTCKIPLCVSSPFHAKIEK